MPSNNNLLGLIMRNKGGAGAGAAAIRQAQGQAKVVENWCDENEHSKTIRNLTITQRGDLVTINGTYNFPDGGGPVTLNLSNGLSTDIKTAPNRLELTIGKWYGVSSEYVSGSIRGTGPHALLVGIMYQYTWLSNSGVPGAASMYDYTISKQDDIPHGYVVLVTQFMSYHYPSTSPRTVTFDDYTFRVVLEESNKDTNARAASKGIAVRLDDGVYTVSGSGTDDGYLTISALDGCKVWPNGGNTVHLKKGRRYKLSMQVSNYPTARNTATGAERTDPEAVQLMLNSGGTDVITISAMQNNPAVFAVDEDTEARLKLMIPSGYSLRGECLTYNNMQLLLALSQADGEEITYNSALGAGDWQEIERGSRVSAEDGTAIACIGHVVDVIGIPNYVDDVSQQSDYHITEKGWYLFCKVQARPKTVYTAEGSITGAAGYIANVGGDCVYLAVKFEVAAQAQLVKIRWDADTEETYIFRAHDLAIRNLDYMTTFYVYDISRYTTWEYALTTDTVFQKNKDYYIHDPMAEAADSYIKADVETEAYVLTADTTFAADKTYYTKEGDEYTAATVTAGEAVPEDTYYEQTTVPVPAYYVQTHPYALTTDATFTEGKTYYTKNEDGTYTAATVTVGEAIPADTYYEQTTAYVQTTDTTFQNGVTYYTKSGTEYTEAVVTTGDPIPAYYNHSKVHFEGMAPNVTYKLDELVDCPIEIALPDIPENGHGAWFEIQMRFNATYSITLLPVTEVKIGTAQTQAQTAGINTVDLQYTAVNGVKMWTLLNTHSNIPTT